MVALCEQPAVAERAEDAVLSPAVLAFLSKFWRCDVPAQIETIYCATVMLRHELIGSHTTAVYKTFLARLTIIAFLDRFGGTALTPGEEIDANDGIIGLQQWPFEAEELGRWLSQPDVRVRHFDK